MSGTKGGFHSAWSSTVQAAMRQCSGGQDGAAEGAAGMTALTHSTNRDLMATFIDLLYQCCWYMTTFRSLTSLNEVTGNLFFTVFVACFWKRVPSTQCSVWIGTQCEKILHGLNFISTFRFLQAHWHLIHTHVYTPLGGCCHVRCCLLSVLPKDTSTHGQLESECEPPTLRSSISCPSEMT